MLFEHLRGMTCIAAGERPRARPGRPATAGDHVLDGRGKGAKLPGLRRTKELDATHGEIKSMRTAAAHLRKGVAPACSPTSRRGPPTRLPPPEPRDRLGRSLPPGPATLREFWLCLLPTVRGLCRRPVQRLHGFKVVRSAQVAMGANASLYESELGRHWLLLTPTNDHHLPGLNAVTHVK